MTSMPTDTKRYLFAGILWKRAPGGLIRRWKKRWFELEKDVLCYYTIPGSKTIINPTPTDLQRKGMILLREITDVRIAGARKGRYGFTIQITGRLYELEAPTEDIAKSWVYQIQNKAFETIRSPKAHGVSAKSETGESSTAQVEISSGIRSNSFLKENNARKSVSFADDILKEKEDKTDEILEKIEENTSVLTIATSTPQNIQAVEPSPREDSFKDAHETFFSIMEEQGSRQLHEEEEKRNNERLARIKAGEEAKRIEEEAKRKEEEEEARKKAEEEEAKRKEEEEEARKKAEEEEAKRKEEEEEAKRKAEEEEAKRKEEEETMRKEDGGERKLEVKEENVNENENEKTDVQLVGFAEWVESEPMVFTSVVDQHIKRSVSVDRGSVRFNLYADTMKSDSDIPPPVPAHKEQPGPSFEQRKEWRKSDALWKSLKEGIEDNNETRKKQAAERQEIIYYVTSSNTPEPIAIPESVKKLKERLWKGGSALWARARERAAEFDFSGKKPADEVADSNDMLACNAPVRLRAGTTQPEDSRARSRNSTSLDVQDDITNVNDMQKTSSLRLSERLGNKLSGSWGNFDEARTKSPERRVTTSSPHPSEFLLKRSNGNPGLLFVADHESILDTVSTDISMQIERELQSRK